VLRGIHERCGAILHIERHTEAKRERRPQDKEKRKKTGEYERKE